MTDFGFEILLFLNDFNTLSISAPQSFTDLREVALIKFHLTKAEFYYIDSDEDKTYVTNESDFLKMYDHASANEIKELIVYVEADGKLKKKKSHKKKNSRANKPMLNHKGSISLNPVSVVSNGNNDAIAEDLEEGLNDYYEGETKDIRNLKFINELEEGIKYSKQSYSKKEKLRVYYIQDKKELQRVENEERAKLKKEKEKKEEEDNKIDENFGKKNRHKKGNKVGKKNHQEEENDDWRIIK